MGKSIFDKFNENVDLEGLQKDIEESSNNEGEFEDVPHGIYEVAIEKMEMVMTKKKPERPMLSVWFKILDGKYKNSRLFMNQLLTSAYPIHLSSEFLRSLESGVEVKFLDYGQFYDNILDVFEAVNGKKEYAVKFEDNKGYDKYTIDKVFDL